MEFDLATAHHRHKGGEAREFLAMARRLVDRGKAFPGSSGGDEAVFHFMNQAREQCRSRIFANTTVNQLASLFAGCAIIEAQPLRVEPSACSSSGQPIELDSRWPSIVQESGRMKIVLDAFTGGNSFICLQCGGLVSIQRKDEHYARWRG